MSRVKSDQSSRRKEGRHKARTDKLRRAQANAASIRRQVKLNNVDSDKWDARFFQRKPLDSLKVKLHFHGLKYILENDVMDEQTRRILQTQLEKWIVKYPQRKGCKQQDSNEPATVNDTETPGSGSDDSDDTSNDDGSGEDHDFDDSNDSYVTSNENECGKEDDNDNVE